MDELSAAWYALREAGVSRETLKFATDTRGFTMETLCDVLEWHTGYRDFEQYAECEA